MTIGWYDGHAFLIKDIKKVANIYACTHCNVINSSQKFRIYSATQIAAQAVKQKSSALAQ